MLRAIHAYYASKKKAVKAVARLYNHVSLNPEYGTWANYLRKHCKLKARKKGYKLYNDHTNGWYIVKPNLEVLTYYGFHGESAFKNFTS